MNLKTKLSENKITIGSWVTIGHPSVIEIMASAGFEWLVIDMEHTAIDLNIAQILITAIQANGIKALVRVSKNEEVIIKKVLDIGADGIIVPMVKCKADALKAVDYAYYPPIGKRGVGLYRAQKYGLGFDEYKQWVDEELVIIVQIEHIEAANNIEEIITTDGINGVIIGPYDLSASMGYPGEFQREEVEKVINSILDNCEKHSFPSGFHVIESNPYNLMERIKQGCTFLAYSLDFFFLGDCARDGMKRINEVKEK